MPRDADLNLPFFSHDSKLLIYSGNKSVEYVRERVRAM